MSMGFTPSLRKKQMTERCSSLVHVASGAAIFTLLLRRRVAFFHRTATCRPLFKPWVSMLPTYRTIERCFEFLSHFWSFNLTRLRSKCVLPVTSDKIRVVTHNRVMTQWDVQCPNRLCLLFTCTLDWPRMVPELPRCTQNKTEHILRSCDRAS